MNWLESLLWDPSSVAHIVCLYAFVISVGVLLGKIKIFGVSLGVTFVLFAGILMGHFGFTGETHILHFIREFGLILFVFCIGLQVGPSFFSSFKKGGCRTRSPEPDKLYGRPHCTGICLRLSAWCGRYHRFHHSHPLYLPGEPQERGTGTQHAGSRC